MWGNAFNDDDKLNPQLADEYGIVMGTSHHEPMLRAQQEWRRFGKGEWNYDHNDSTLREFWRQGIRNMDSHESIVTVGMRGDGDMPMTEGSNIALLERIVADQRKIIGEVTGKDPSATPQLWALYKEVRTTTTRGMPSRRRHALFSDDNWGKYPGGLPKPAPPRRGGYGVYYHFDYVGGREIKGITNQVPHLGADTAYEHGVIASGSRTSVTSSRWSCLSVLSRLHGTRISGQRSAFRSTRFNGHGSSSATRARSPFLSATCQQPNPSLAPDTTASNYREGNGRRGLQQSPRRCGRFCPGGVPDCIPPVLPN